jgi:hypothetical protein
LLIIGYSRGIVQVVLSSGAPFERANLTENNGSDIVLALSTDALDVACDVIGCNVLKGK